MSLNLTSADDSAIYISRLNLNSKFKYLLLDISNLRYKKLNFLIYYPSYLFVTIPLLNKWQLCPSICSGQNLEVISDFSRKRSFTSHIQSNSCQLSLENALRMWPLFITMKVAVLLSPLQWLQYFLTGLSASTLVFISLSSAGNQNDL